MKVDTEILQTVSNYAQDKGLSRQHIYRLEQNGELDIIRIDGVAFVLLNDKARNFQRKRAVKRKSS
jgi:DNA-binding phage protein